MSEPASGPAPAKTSATDRHADRYGTRPRARRLWPLVLLGIGVVAAGLAVAYVGFDKYGPKGIDTEQLGYVVADDATLDMRIMVTRDDPDQDVACVVRAMDRDGAEVGRRELLIPASGHGSVEVATTVHTSARAAAGDIYGCSADVPEYLRGD